MRLLPPGYDPDTGLPGVVEAGLTDAYQSLQAAAGGLGLSLIAPAPFSGAAGTRIILDPPLEPDRLRDQVARLLRELPHPKPPIRWLAGPNNSLPELPTLLEGELGFRRVEEDLVGMAANLPSLADPPTAPPGVVLQEVDHCDAVKRWLRVVPRPYHDLFTRLEFRAPWRRVVALRQGVPVAGVLSHQGGPIAAVLWLGYQKDAQGRAAGLYLLEQLLAGLRGQGCEVAVAAPPESEAPLYRRAGLQEVSRYEQYLLGP